MEKQTFCLLDAKIEVFDDEIISHSIFNYCIFALMPEGSIDIEKLLKAIYVKVHKKHAVHGHDLLRLTSNLDLELDSVKEDWLDQLTTFNINSRYDSYKQEFYSLCTKEFAIKWASKIEELREWLRNQL